MGAPETSKQLKQYTGNAAKLIKILSAGQITQRQAAEAVGVSEALVSQLMAEEDFAYQVAVGMSKNLERAFTIDDNIEEVENILSQRLRELMGMAQAMNLDTILKVLKYTNGAKRKTQAQVPGVGTGQGTIQNNTLKLILPSVVINNYTVNPQNEVVAVGGQELVTLNSKSMETLMAQKQANAPPAQLPEPDKEIQATYVKLKDPYGDL